LAAPARRAIAALHEEIAALGSRIHRVKRFIGRTTQGFDFPGYRIRAGARLRPPRGATTTDAIRAAEGVGNRPLAHKAGEHVHVGGAAPPLKASTGSSA